MQIHSHFEFIWELNFSMLHATAIVKELKNFSSSPSQQWKCHIAFLYKKVHIIREMFPLMREKENLSRRLRYFNNKKSKSIDLLICTYRVGLRNSLKSVRQRHFAYTQNISPIRFILFILNACLPLISSFSINSTPLEYSIELLHQYINLLGMSIEELQQKKKFINTSLTS